MTTFFYSFYCWRNSNAVHGHIIRSLNLINYFRLWALEANITPLPPHFHKVKVVFQYAKWIVMAFLKDRLLVDCVETFENSQRRQQRSIDSIDIIDPLNVFHQSVTASTSLPRNRFLHRYENKVRQAKRCKMLTPGWVVQFKIKYNHDKINNQILASTALNFSL